MEQANAAQMAARNIKAAKSRRRPTPVQSAPGAPQSMQFGMGGGGRGQGGLFGGSVQATGTFDFTAPSGGLSFPPSTFGGNNMFGVSSSAENGNDAGVGGDEDRRKKSFRGSPGPAINTPVQSSLFGQSQLANPFTSVNGQASNPFNFLQNTSQPSSPGLGGFNSTPTLDKPSIGSIFSFGGAPSQPASPAPTNIFGSAPSREKPADNLFGFNQPVSQPASQGTPTLNFGSSAPVTAQDNPPNNSLFFSQSSAQSSSPRLFGATQATKAPSSNIFGISQPSSSGINFGSTPAAENPSTNLFGTSQPSQPTSSTEKPPTDLFGISQPSQPTLSTLSFGSGSTTQQSAPSNNLFAHLNTPATPSNNLFGGQQEPKPASSTRTLFGGLNQQPSAASNLFGTSNQTPAKSIDSGEQKTAKPSSSLFSDLNKPAEPSNTLFGSPNSAPTSNLFASTPAKSTNDLFGNLNKPVDQPALEPKANGAGGDVKVAESSSSSLFSQSPSPHLFGGSASKSSAPSSQTETNNSNNSTTFSFGGSQPATSTAQTNGKNTPNFSFGSPQPSSLTPLTGGKTPSSPMKTMEAPSSASQPPPSGMFPILPPPSPAKSNSASGKTSPSTALTKAITERTSNALIKDNGTDDVDYDPLYAEMDAACVITKEQMDPLIPTHFTDNQRNEFYAAYRLRSLNMAVEKFFSAVTVNMGISNLIKYYNVKKVEILDRSSLPHLRSKRKITDNENQENENRHKRPRQDATPSTNVFQAQSSIPTSKRSKPSDDEDQENENPNRRSRQDALPKSNLFRAQAHPQTASSPEKSTRSHQQPCLNGSTPKAPSFVPSPSFAPSTASPNAAPVASPPTKSKRKAESQLTRETHEKELEEGRLKKLRSKGDSTVSGGSNTSNIFKSIVDSPEKASPEKKIAPIQCASSPSKDDAPHSNPFVGLPVPKSPTRRAASSSTRAGFAFTPTSNATSSVFGSMSTYHPSSFPSKPAPDSAEPKVCGIKPPTFSFSGGNLMSQFAAKAEETEKKRMEKAKAEDMDSDDDEKEWEAEWYAKEAAKKKELEGLRKSGTGFVFDASKSDIPNSSTLASRSESPAPATAPPPLFGQPAQNSSNSVFGSRSSTPGALGSSTGSVLDGHISNQPVSENIFGHLSNTVSENSQVDDDSQSASNGEEDSENKDPNYEPDEDSGSGPGTPVEETGAGIAPTSSRELGGLNSGTSTPGRSLFDRITRDSSGNPVRQQHTENQENTPPPTTTNVPNLFASLSSTSPLPTNQTWNPNSPIKFGKNAPSPNATPTRTPTSNFFGNLTPSPNGNTNPIVSVTEPTPTRAPMSNLFGSVNNSASAPNSPFPGLFGSSPQPPTSGGPTSGVGFSFGQPSATSSLFPSAAASTTTSRATSPGNTTDGDSAAEDPDAEKHEQLDLTSGDAGAEDEEKIHEVRAKATKFIPKDGDTPGAWKARGVGRLSVFKHKETGATRLVLRAEPRGHIALNKGLLAKVDYKADGKTVKLLAAADGGNGLETWILQVKTKEMAEALAEVLESNKPSQ